MITRNSTATLANQASNYLAAGMVPGRLGNAHPSIVPYHHVPTADGDMALAVWLGRALDLE